MLREILKERQNLKRSLEKKRLSTHSCLHFTFELLRRLRLSLTRYFLDRLDDIASPDYLPSNDDILRMRNVTEVAYESEFRPEPANPDVRLKLIDVGGQRPLRWGGQSDVSNGAGSLLIMIHESRRFFSVFSPDEATL